MLKLFKCGLLDQNFDNIYYNIITNCAMKILTFANYEINLNRTQIQEIVLVLHFLDVTFNTVNAEIYNLDNLFFSAKMDSIQQGYLLLYITNASLELLAVNSIYSNSSTNGSLANEILDTIQNFTILLRSLGMYSIMWISYKKKCFTKIHHFHA